MIEFPKKPDQESDFLREREAHYAHPPLPLPLDRPDGPQPLVTARWAWMQPVPDMTDMDHREAAAPAAHELVRRIEAYGNPLRQLAAALLDAADQADRDGFVPFGINLETRYYFPWTQYMHSSLNPHREARCAIVAVTARGVRREWLDGNRATEEAEVLL